MSIELVQQNLRNILKAIQDCLHTSSLTNQCRLVAVSKTKPAELIEALYREGHREFGENYVQELEEKSANLEISCPDIRWHFIGQVQSNKIAKICNSPGIYCVQTVENEKHAALFNKEWEKRGLERKLHVLIQVNTSQEDNKGGILPGQAPELGLFIRNNCKSLEFDGFMTIGSFEHSHDSGSNPDFEALRSVRKAWSTKTGESEDSLELSMGMSDDFLQAIKQGSTCVRVGSKLFGAREYK